MAKCVECGGNISYVTKDILKCEYCGKLYSEIDGNLTSANQASIYETAVIKSQSTNPETLEEAIELFSILGSYKNSGSLEYQCRNQIHQNKIAQEEKRLEERRQAELAEKAYKVQKEKDAQIRKAKLIAIATIIGFVVIVGTIIGVSKHSKNVKYENAVNLYEQGHYEEAMEAFEKMGDYKDAKSQVESIRNQIQVRKNTYEQGIAYYNSGAYAEAIQQLQEVADYEDTADYLEQASSILYQQAQDAVNNGDYKLAQEKITAIPEGYSISTQAKTLLVEIDQKVAEQERVENYAQAVSYYDDGQYDLAQPLFIGLEDYSNSKEYLNNIGTNFYTQASEQIEAGNLEAAVQKLTLIDEATEWENYQSAIDLKENTIASYKENIKIKAAMLYKEDGNDDMVSYLNSVVGDIFQQEEASSLKKEIVKMYMPIELTNCPEVDNAHLNGNIKYEIQDIFQNKYEYGIEYYDPYVFDYTTMSYAETYQTYYLSGKYKHFSATIVPCETGGEEAVFKIYVDGNKVFSCQITDTSKPQKIDLEVTGGEELKIAFINGYQADLLLAEPYLYEN